MAHLRPRVILARDVGRKGAQHAEGARPRREDPYLVRVVQYIPSEVVAAYVAGSGAIAQLSGPEPWEWIWFGFLLVVTPVWTAVATRAKGEPVAWFQAGAATVAFVAWVFGLGGPFARSFPASYETPLGGLVLIAVTLLVPVCERLLVRPIAVPEEDDRE